MLRQPLGQSKVLSSHFPRSVVFLPVGRKALVGEKSVWTDSRIGCGTVAEAEELSGHESMRACQTRPRSIVVAVSGLLVLFGCDEQLPPYAKDPDVLAGTIRPNYVLSMTENVLKVRIVVTNIYDETLEGSAVLNGYGQIVLARKRELRKTFQLTRSDRISGGSFNPQTGELIFDPGDSLVFQYTWDFITDDSTDLRTSEFQYYVDPSCPSRMIAYGERFEASATVAIFDRVAVVTPATVTSTVCYVTPYVAPNYCPPINTNQPCQYVR